MRTTTSRSSRKIGAPSQYHVYITGTLSVVMDTGSLRDARRRIGEEGGYVTNDKGVVVMRVSPARKTV